VSDTEQPTEIVIVRRRGGHGEEAHHGGVWKIAFADFMTAMMAFFLVLWIVNSTSKETKTAVARYFNPVKLSETSPARKGLQDPKDAQFEAAPDPHQKADKQDDPPEHKSKNEKPETAPAKTSERNDAATASAGTAGKAGSGDDAKKVAAAAARRGSPTAIAEVTLMEDPMSVLDDIAGTLDGSNPAERADGLPANVPADAQTRLTFKDPFEPIAPTILPKRNLKSEGLRGNAPPSQSQPSEATGDAGDALVPPVSIEGNVSKAMVQQAQQMRQAVEAALMKQTPGKDAPKVEVSVGSEGILISLTDAAGFAMFDSSSAVPQGQTVKLLGEVGKRLRDMKGSIVLRGHTDNRPFKAGASDNWRLSSARAQTAFYMLVRGGLDEKRVERVEGYADRHPKNAKNPGAPENRRIEILVRPEGKP
jgi:chemotaxis protein MotB